MVVLIICKNEEDPIKIKALEYEDDQKQSRKSGNTFSPIISICCCFFFRESRTANSTVGGQIWPNFELVRTFMHALVTCTYKKIG